MADRQVSAVLQKPEGDIEGPAFDLRRRGFVALGGGCADVAEAWSIAARVADRACSLATADATPKLEVVGRFRMPPDGVEQRDFQALHIDFGLPRSVSPSVPLARFTALYVDPGQRGSGVGTRLVPLGGLLGQRAWPRPEAVLRRLTSAADCSAVEGILARVVQCVDASDDLPAKDADGFLCGMEFDTIEDERRYFLSHGLDLEQVEQEVVLLPGQLLIFDNLAVAHGRRGRRNSGELHQLCLGVSGLGLAGQREQMRRFVSLFGPMSAAPGRG